MLRSRPLPHAPLTSRASSGEELEAAFGTYARDMLPLLSPVLSCAFRPGTGSKDLHSPICPCPSACPNAQVPSVTGRKLRLYRGLQVTYRRGSQYDVAV